MSVNILSYLNVNNQDFEISDKSSRDVIEEIITNVGQSLSELDHRTQAIPTALSNLYNDLALTPTYTASTSTGADLNPTGGDSYEYSIAKLHKMLSEKQDTLVSGTNIKTIGGVSVLGSGDIDLPTGPQGLQGVTGPEGLQGLQGIQGLQGPKGDPGDDYVLTEQDKTDIVDIAVTELTPLLDDKQNNLVADGSYYVDAEINGATVKLATKAYVDSKDPFMLLDFNQTINVNIPYCTENIANTSIPNIDISISEELGANWAIAALAKYEVTDSSSQRINCWPVCSFSMNTQKILRLRMMCAGTSKQEATKIAGAILLKRR